MNSKIISENLNFSSFNKTNLLKTFKKVKSSRSSKKIINNKLSLMVLKVLIEQPIKMELSKTSWHNWQNLHSYSRKSSKLLTLRIQTTNYMQLLKTI